MFDTKEFKKLNWQICGATQPNNDFMLWMVREFTLHKKRGMKVIGHYATWSLKLLLENFIGH
jgi:hypothetical protein